MEMSKKLVWIYACSLGLLVCKTYSKEFLNIAVLPAAPYLFESDDGNFTGFLPELLDKVAYSINFDYKFYYPNDSTYGANENGEWSGMMREVIDGSADIALPLTVSNRRAQAVDFTIPLQVADPTIVLRKPPPPEVQIKDQLTKLLAPMEFPVWLMTVLAFFVTGTVLYIISHTNPYEWRKMAKDREATLREAESFTCLNSFWFVISTLAWQGYVRAPRSMGGRIAVTAWWIFVLIFILSYTASLTNFLRVGPNPTAVEGYTSTQSFADLAKNAEVKVGMLDGGTTATNFEHSVLAEDRLVHRKAVEFAASNAPIKQYDEGLRHLRERPFLDFAMVMESPSARYAVHHPPCDLYMVSDPRSTRFIAMAVAKDSPRLEELNQALLMLFETGEYTQLEQKWFEPQCAGAVLDTRGEAHKVAPFYKLDLGTFSGALLILLIGLMLGGLVSAMEFCIYKGVEMHSDDEKESATTPLSNHGFAVSEQQLTVDHKRGGATEV